MDMKLELVGVPVTDIDRAKEFYVDIVGFHLDHDHAVSDEVRFVQLTPPGSACSIAIGKGLTQMVPGGLDNLQLVVADADAIRAAYARIGRDDAVVSPRTIDLGENRVNVVYDINEGGRTKIRAVNFIGNNAFGDRRLSDVVATKRTGLLSFFTRDDIYDEDRLRARQDHAVHPRQQVRDQAGDREGQIRGSRNRFRHQEGIRAQERKTGAVRRRGGR